MLLILCAANLVLCILLILAPSRRKHDEASRLDRQAQLINQVADELLDALDAQKADVARSLKESDDRRAQMAQLQQAQLGQLDARMEQLRLSLTGGMTELRQDSDRRLTEIRRTVDEKLTESLDKRLSASFQQVSARLEQVWKGLGEMQTLAVGVGDLKKVLTNVKTRGTWGEIQLGRLLAEILAPGQYESNVGIVPGSQERVEYAIRLPGQDGAPLWLPIDSKFPQEDWLRLQEAAEKGDAARTEACRRALAARLKTEAKRIADKYIVPPYSTDFAVMFLPVEGLYAEAVRDGSLTEEIQREHRVVAAGPSTFAALLNALQMGFRTLAIEQRSGEVWQLLSEVKSDFGRFAETLEKTRQRLQQASESMDTAFTRTRQLQRRLSAVESLGTPEDPEAQD
ncbi:MAG: DNA recombination protein RmuC [Clostridia bacterium]|nr:DNA recombination protein RmuC [Clostridia bacterium]